MEDASAEMEEKAALGSVTRASITKVLVLKEIERAHRVEPSTLWLHRKHE